MRVVVDHAQRRVSKPRVGIVCRGIDFMEGDLNGLWVNPIWGVLQSKPNSEETEYSTTGTGRWAKFTAATVTVQDNNGHPEFLVAGGVNHTDDALRYSGGDNTAGVGVTTTATYPENTGINVAQYSYGHADETGGVLIEFGWNTTSSGTVGESVRVYHDGALEIYRDGVRQIRSSFGSGGYQFGTVRGGSFEKASDQFVTIRAEIRPPFLILTSSKGGIFIYSCPWAEDQYAADGTVETPAEPVVRSSNLWWYVPSGGVSVIASPVVYVPSGSATSVPLALSEPPVGGGSFAARPVPADSAVTVSLVDPNGTSSFDTSTNRCRVKVVASAAPVWVDATSTRYDPVVLSTEDDETDITEWVRSLDLALEDGPEGLVATLEIGYDAPVGGLEEIENRPFRIDLIPHPEDEDPGETLILLDGVGGPPEWVDSSNPDVRSVRIVVKDRLSLLKDAQTTELVIFDGSKLCQPIGSGDSAVWVCLRQAGLSSAEVDLPDIDFDIEHWPPQKADDFGFAAEPGAKWWDILTKLFDYAPSLIWGIKPTATGPRFFVVDPDVPVPPVATLYRTPEEAALDADYDGLGQLGAFPMLYDEHRRTKLPIEGNFVRVMGINPATNRFISAAKSDDDSRSPIGTRNGRWLGTTRAVLFQSETLTTQLMVNKVLESLYKAVRQRQYVEPWRSFMLFKGDGVPAWRGDLVLLKAALPDGEDSEVRISSMNPEIIDEHGGGLMDSSGILAPVSIRLANYTGGAILGLGGSGEKALVARHHKRIQLGGWYTRSDKFPKVSPASNLLT